METIIGFIILIASGLGIVFIVYKKIPLLADYNPPVFDSHIFDRVTKHIKNHLIIKKIIPNELLLLKVLSKIMLYVLKVENKIAGWLNKLRQKSVKQLAEKSKTFTEGNYWEHLKEKRKSGKKPKKFDNFTPLF